MYDGYIYRVDDEDAEMEFWTALHPMEGGKVLDKLCFDHFADGVEKGTINLSVGEYVAVLRELESITTSKGVRVVEVPVKD